jgi:hypothetical protein
VPDSKDAFPDDKTRWKESDRDGDGVADSKDAFPDDKSKWKAGDRDGDGVPDSKDVFPDDKTQWKANDRDGDGVPDSKDAFPDDKTKWKDRFGRDTALRDALNEGDDAVLDDVDDEDREADEDEDSDGDGVPDSEDFFPHDELRWKAGDGDGGSDRDGDGVPDSKDSFPDDKTRWQGGDRDGDGVPDSKDAFPDDSTRWAKGPAIDVNMDELSFLTSWSSNMDGAVHDMETKIHPHGHKWWRYRYQYSFVESVFLIPCIILSYLFHRMFHYIALYVRLIPKQGYVAWISVHKYWTTKEPTQGMYKFVLIGFVFHAAGMAMTICFLVRFLYRFEFFNYLAIFVRWLLEADNPDSNIIVPYTGENYYETLCSVMSHLMWGFLLFAVMAWHIVQGYVKGARQFRAMELMSEARQSGNAERINATTDKLRRENLLHWVTQKVTPDAGETGAAQTSRALPEEQLLIAKEPFREYEVAFLTGLKNCCDHTDHERELTMHLSDLGIDMENWNSMSVQEHQMILDKFPLRKYFRLVFQSAAAALAIPHWTTCVALCILCIIAGLNAFFLKIAFVFLLPPVVLCLIITFICLHLFARRLLRQTLDMKKDTSLPDWMTMKRVSHTIQCMLYCLCYMVARLVFSKHMWHEFFWVSALTAVLFLVLLAALSVWGTITMKQLMLAMSLPPNIQAKPLLHFLDLAADKCSDFPHPDEGPNCGKREPPGGGLPP